MSEVRLPEVVVIKFGSSVLRSTDDLPAVVHKIYGDVRRGRAVVAVVSALGGTTDQLLAQARALGAGDDHATAALLATGEAASVALLALALARAGVPAHTADARALGLRTHGAVLDAEPVDVDVPAICRLLAARPVLVVPGFVGVDGSGRTALLGRGGSDLSAVFLAARLRAQACVLCKDVDGLFDRDPALAPGRARRFACANYDDARAHGGRLVQSKAIDAAQVAGVELTVAALVSDGGTRIGAGASAFAPSPASRPSGLRVGLIGLGTVGGGVYERLRTLEASCDVVAVGVRDAGKPRAHAGVPFARDLSALVHACDVVVDASDAAHDVLPVLRAALVRGVHVVSANKALLARHLAELRAAARAGGSRLLFSAAVGGAVPMLSLVRRLRARGIARIDAVLNTTSHFVLSEVGSGATLAAALAAARAAGFAERDATRDLGGRDAASKLVLLAEAGFGVVLREQAIARDDVAALAAPAPAPGRVLRAVASLAGTPAGITGEVRVRELSAGDPLFDTPRTHNRIVVTTNDGARHVADGGGAGRWPTTEAVVGDLLELCASDAVRASAPPAVEVPA